MTTKWAMATAMTWGMAMATRVEGNEEGDGKEKGEGGKGNGDGNKGGGQATATTWAMTTLTKQAIARAGRAVATEMMMAGNKEGDGKGGNDDGNGDGNNDVGRQRGQWRRQ